MFIIVMGTIRDTRLVYIITNKGAIGGNRIRNRQCSDKTSASLLTGP